MKKNLLTTLTFLLLFHCAQAQNPNLWGIASNGGANNDGSIIKISGDGSGFTTVYSFNSPTSGAFPGGHLLFNGDQKLYGMAFLGGAHNSGTIFRIDPVTNIFTKLHDMDTLGFSWVNSDLVRANDSTLYGLVYTGGPQQRGQIFRFNPFTSAYSVVYTFDSLTGTGTRPRNIMMGSDDKIYGTTDKGGVNLRGTLFSFDPATSTFADLHDFDSTTATGTLLEASNGKIYGLTAGAPGAIWGYLYSYDRGTSAYTVEHGFDSTAYPGWINGLTEGANGILYGMTYYGTVRGIFRFNTVGNIYEKIYNFTGASGTEPVSSLITGSDGNLYGMTTEGAANAGGAIIRFNPADSTFTNLKSLTQAGGYRPYGGLTEVPAGTGFAEQTASNEVMIYPNPTGDKFTVHGLPFTVRASIEIYNVIGKRLLVCKQENSVDVSTLAPGIYFLSVTGEGKKWTARFVKE